MSSLTKFKSVKFIQATSMSQRIPSLFISTSNLHGRGVFTTEAIAKGNTIEVCPVIPLPTQQLQWIDKTILYDYYFEWDDNEMAGALVLGYGSIYNHSRTPNARYLVDLQAGTLDVFSIKDIEAGEEITFNYNGLPDDQTPQRFEK